MQDFFVSYTKADKAWAEWIAWTLEEVDYSVAIQAWDFRPGNNFVLEMQRATIEANKTIAVLSPNYLQSGFAAPEWAAAFAKDPQGKERKLIPVRVAECEPVGMLGPLIYVDLVGFAEEDARAALLGAFSDRAKPASSPAFPGSPTSPTPRAAPDKRTYPGASNAASESVVPTLVAKAESTSHERSVKDLSAVERLRLKRRLNSLEPQQFNMLVFAVNPPAGVIPPMPASQESRVSALLGWAEEPGGCGLTTLREVFEALPKKAGAQIRKHIVVLIHGIGDKAAWQTEIPGGITDYVQEHPSDEHVETISIGYGIFGVFRFLLPIGLIRHTPVSQVWRQLRSLRRAEGSAAKISLICHSFGCYVIGRILLKEFDSEFHNIILVGSILPRTYPWHVFSQERVNKVLNEVGIRDIWPLIAKSTTWGYGISGWYGFRQSRVVIDRFWHTKHSELLTSQHARTHWAPFIFHTTVTPGQKDERPPYWMVLLSTGLLKYVALLLLLLLLSAVITIPYSYEEQVRVMATTDLKLNVPSISIASFTDSKERQSSGLLVIPPHSKVRFVAARTEKWTNDALDIIEAFVKAQPFLVDVAELIKGWNNSVKHSNNPEEAEKNFIGWLRQQHDEVLVMDYRIASDRRDMPEAQSLEQDLEQFTHEVLVPALKDKSSLIQGHYFVVGTNKEDLYKFSSLKFWKRIVAYKFLQDRVKHVLGPYYGVEGQVGEETTFLYKLKAPDPLSSPACLLAALYKPERGAKDLGEPSFRRFYEPSHELMNDSNNPQYVRLGMDDDIPSDNGLGYCEVRVVMTTTVSILNRFIIMWSTANR